MNEQREPIPCKDDLYGWLNHAWHMLHKLSRNEYASADQIRITAYDVQRAKMRAMANLEQLERYRKALEEIVSASYVGSSPLDIAERALREETARE